MTNGQSIYNVINKTDKRIEKSFRKTMFCTLWQANICKIWQTDSHRYISLQVCTDWQTDSHIYISLQIDKRTVMIYTYHHKALHSVLRTTIYTYHDIIWTIHTCFFFVCLFGVYRMKNFTGCWLRATVLAYFRHSWLLSSEGSLACHTYCDTRHPFTMVISEDPWHSHLLPNVWQWSCHYRF